MEEIFPPSRFRRQGFIACSGSKQLKFYEIVIEEPIERIKIKAVIVSDEENAAKKISDLIRPAVSEETVGSHSPKFCLKRCLNRKRKAVPELEPNLVQLSEVKMKFPFILKTVEQLEIEDIDRQMETLLSRKKSLEEMIKKISERCQMCEQELKK